MSGCAQTGFGGGGGTGGAGTAGFIPVWVTAATLGDSVLQQATVSGLVAVGMGAAPSYDFDINRSRAGAAVAFRLGNTNAAANSDTIMRMEAGADGNIGTFFVPSGANQWWAGYGFTSDIFELNRNSTGPGNGTNVWTAGALGTMGIATRSPQFPLDVAGNLRLQGTSNLYFGGTGAADWEGRIVQDGTNLRFVNTDAAGGMTWSTGAAETLRMTMLGTGLLGINESTPVNYLHITGAGAANEFMTQRNQASTSGNMWESRKSRGTAGTPTTVTAGDLILEILSRGYGNAGTYSTGASIRTMCEATPGGGSNASQLMEFRTAATGASTVVAMAIMANANVGVGPWSLPSTLIPEVRFHVLNTAGATAEMILQSSNAAANNSVFYIRKSRGTPTAPGNIVTNDYYGSIAAQGYTGSWFDTASIRFLCVGTVTAAQRPASQIEFWANVANTVASRWGYLEGDGTWNFDSPLSIFGSGGAGNAKIRFDGFLNANPTPPASMGELFFFDDGAGLVSFKAYYRDGGTTKFAEIPLGSAIGGGQQSSLINKNADFTVAHGERTYLCDAGAGGITVTLPAGLPGEQFCIKKVAGAGSVTLDPAGGNLIDGAASAAIATQWASLEVQSDGTDWFVVSSHL